MVSFTISTLKAWPCQFYVQKSDGPVASIFTETGGSNYVGNKSTKQLVGIPASFGTQVLNTHMAVFPK